MTAARRRERVRLPRYFRVKPLKGGTDAYFWEPPTWARPKKAGKGTLARRVPVERNGRACPVEAQPLGTDLAAAIGKAENLNAAFEEWRLGVEVAAPKGTVAGMFADYRRNDRFKALGAESRRQYQRGMDRLVKVQLKTQTFGQMRVQDVKARHADLLYKHLLGKHGRRQAGYAMQAARRAWYEWGRDNGAPNPFARMNISLKAEKGNRPTSRAEYDLFRATARELGHQSMATAAALAFELIRRVSDVFGYVSPDPDEEPGGIYWEHYQPGESILLVQHKTGREQLIPLCADDGEPLFPELEEELARTPRGRPDIEIDGQMLTPIVLREGKDGKPAGRYTERAARAVFARIREEAGLPREMTLTGFRHGGATEAGDAQVDAGARDLDLRPLTGHATREMAEVYDKVTIAKARVLATSRRRFVDAQRAAE